LGVTVAATLADARAMRAFAVSGASLHRLRSLRRCSD
jgi:hypothetical protein